MWVKPHSVSALKPSVVRAHKSGDLLSGNPGGPKVGGPDDPKSSGPKCSSIDGNHHLEFFWATQTFYSTSETASASVFTVMARRTVSELFVISVEYQADSLQTHFHCTGLAHHVSP